MTNFFVKMGCCCGKNEDEDRPYEEADERTRLLADPVRRTSNPVTSEASSSLYKAGSPLQKSDEHQALSAILDETVRNIIDVSQMDNTVSDQHDHLDRTKKYTERIQNSMQAVPTQLPCLALKDIANVEKALAAPSHFVSDYSMMLQACNACSSAVKNISVHPRDDLLVTFAVRA
ncbi:ragulator complex protein LAMTOR1 [Hyalella azteca]|uniref:Ragulator complex protein LAMTOR1 n=1 Tax=Hyalella azteca TaxID=294128 RepID=A0A8B7PBN7_HYAAZ|nr:ragulator complex protein LAMTOR1 [Hyalella azteca]